MASVPRAPSTLWAGVFIADFVAAAILLAKAMDQHAYLAGLACMVGLSISAFLVLRWVEELARVPKARPPFKRPFPDHGGAKETKPLEVDGP